MRTATRNDMTVEIRPERPGDEEAIHAVTTAAFLEAPHTGHTEQYIVRELRRAGQLAVSLVAVLDGTIVGHVAISPVTIDDGTRGWFGLGPVSVTPQHQGLGIGSRLVREALQRLRAMGGKGCVLVGEPVYYERFGFRAEPRMVLPGVPPQYFQALCFGTPAPAGVVTFHKAFDATA
jgi:putative acetyltransferase